MITSLRTTIRLNLWTVQLHYTGGVHLNILEIRYFIKITQEWGCHATISYIVEFFIGLIAIF